MADYVVLFVGNKELIKWKWGIDEKDIPILRFIFTENDRKIKKKKDEDYYFYTYTLRTTVKNVKDRFNKFHFTIKEIDKIISGLLDIKPNKVEFALLGEFDEDEFYEKYPEPDEDDKRAYARYQRIWDEKAKIDTKRAKTNLGYYPILRHIRKLLDSSKNNEKVHLEFEYDPDEGDEIELFPETYESIIKVELKYLENAKVHFTTGDFNLVYIELFIALESAITTYITIKSKEILKKSHEIINIESMTKDLSLIDLIKFGLVFIGKKRVKQELFDSLRTAYDMRNNVIHNNAKRFKIKDVIESIEIVEKVIKMMKT